MDGEQGNLYPYRWGHENGSYAAHHQQPSLDNSPQPLAGGNHHHHHHLHPQPAHQLQEEDGCPQYSCYKTAEPSPTLMASLLHLVEGDAPSTASAATFASSSSKTSFFPTSTSTHHPYPALQQLPPYSATAPADDQEWDEVVAYLSRQPWPAAFPPQLQELTTGHEAHYPAALITPPASGTSGRRAAAAPSSSSPILLGPQLAPQAYDYDHQQQTLYQHPDHHLWMHNHARHATTSPAAGGQQRKRRHRGSDNAARSGWTAAPTATCSSNTTDGYALRDGIGVDGSRGGARHEDLFDGYFSPPDAAALYDERASLQLITPTAATASRLQQAMTADQGEEEEEEDNADEGALHPYTKSALQRPSKVLAKVAALGRNKARRIWTEDAHLRLAAMGLCYLDTYRKKVWVYATIHPSAMAGDNVRSSLERGFDGWTSKEEATLGVSVLMVLAQGAAQAGDKKVAKEFFMKARQAAGYVGGDSSDYTLAEALVSIAIFAHIEGEMDDREVHQILDKAMQICHRVPALNSDAYHRCMFMKSILRFTSPSDMRMLDEAFCSVKKLPYYTYFVDGQTRETMPYGMSVMQGIADTAIVLFHVIIALNMKNQGFSSGCATAGSHHMDNDIVQLVRTVLSLEVRLETIAKDWPPFMYLSLRLCAIASRAQCFWMLGLQRQAYKCIEDYIQLSQKRKLDSSFEFLGPPVLRADHMILSILAEKDDGELVFEMFDAMKINEVKMPGLRKLRERYDYLLDRKSSTQPAAANGSSFASFPPSSSFFHPAVASFITGAQRCSGPAPPQTSPATVCCPPFSPAVLSDFPSPPSSSRATHLSSTPPASSALSSAAVPPLAGRMPAEPPAVTTSPPRQPVDTLLFGLNVPAAAAESHSTSSDDATPSPTPAAAPSRLLEPQNAEFFAELQRKERDMTALEQRMYKVRAKTQNLDERIESLEELVAIYETIVSAEDADTAAKDQLGAAAKQERRNGSSGGRPRRDARSKAGKTKTKCGARGYDVERADAHQSTPLLGSPCASSSSSPPSQTTSSSPVMSPSHQPGWEGGAVPSRLSPSSSSSSLSSSSSVVFPSSSPELVLTDEEEFFREIFASANDEPHRHDPLFPS